MTESIIFNLGFAAAFFGLAVLTWDVRRLNQKLTEVRSRVADLERKGSASTF